MAKSRILPKHYGTSGSSEGAMASVSLTDAASSETGAAAGSVDRSHDRERIGAVKPPGQRAQALVARANQQILSLHDVVAAEVIASLDGDVGAVGGGDGGGLRLRPRHR